METTLENPTLSQAKKQRYDKFLSESNFKAPVLGADKVDTKVAPESKEEAAPEIKTGDPVKEEPKIVAPVIPADNKQEVKKPSYTKSLKQEVTEAKEEARKLQESLKKQEEEKSQLSSEMENLKKQIEESSSKKEIEELQTKFKDVETYRDSLLTENKELKERQDLLDVLNSDTFKEQYQKPVGEAYKSIVSLLNSDPSLISEFDKAAKAQDAAMSATTAEERYRQEGIRDEIFQSVWEQLTPSKQGHFSGLFYSSFIPKNQAYYEEFSNKQQLVTKIKQEEARRKQESAAKFQSTWKGAFDESFKEIEGEFKYSDEVATIIKSKGIEDSTDRDLEIAKDVIAGGNNFPTKEVARVIAQGANAVRLKAQLKAKDIIIQELNETISKYKGTSTDGALSSDSRSKDPSQPEKNSREFILSKWGAKR